ncbi:MAG: response regulator transcription factor [Oscillospiraceae bacterium]
MKIIIVEDDENIRDELCHFLKSYGYEVFALDKFDTVTEDILSSGGQLVLLDINLPMYDGYYICREIRKKSDIPIIIVTSRDSELDELMSMNLGADDFIAKPYNTQILLARISSLLKRAYKTSPAENLEYGGVTLNTSNGVITFKGKSCELTKNEHKILQILMNNQGKIISRTEIMNMLWQSEEFVDENTLTVNVNRLRRKLSEIGVEDFLKTKRGQGYYI